MNAIASDLHTGDTPTTASGSPRWGVRLQELSAEVAPPELEPLQWKPRPRFWQRVQRGLAVPATAAAVVFIAIVLISVTVVSLRPHTIDAARDLSDATTQASPATPSEEASFAGEAGQREHAGQDASAAPLPVLVHVVGEVQRPGVYELAEGSRVLAAIEAAGGATDTAALTAVNLARILVDGEQLVIPNAEAAASAAAPAAPAGATPGTAPAGGLVSLNTADQAALETLPRVGPALAARIVAWRSANGGFQSIDQLLNVSGIGQKTFEQLQEHVTL